MIRYAVVRGARTRKEVEAYLYAGFKVGNGFMAPAYEGASYDVLTFEIEGEDWAGFTLDALLARMATGLIIGEEVYP